MKVVDVAEFYADRGGGVKTYIRAKLRAAAALGHEVVVAAPAPGGESRTEERDGGRIRWIGGPGMPFDSRYGLMWNRRAVHRILDEEQPDLVEGSSPWTGGWFAAGWKGSAKKVFVFHQDPVAVFGHTGLDRWQRRDTIDTLSWPFWAWLRRLSHRYDATVVSGTWLATRLQTFRLKNPIAVPFGIDKAFFSSERRSDEVRERWLSTCGLGPNASLLVAVGRFHPEKRLKTVIEAARQAGESRPIGLVVFGDGPFAGGIRRAASRIPAVHLAGFTSDRDELADVLASADLLLHGSAAETYGLGVAEALCSGLPAIVPSVGGAADLVSEACGRTYEPGNADAAAAAVLAALDRRPELAAGCARAMSRIYTVEQHFEELFATYERLLDA